MTDIEWEYAKCPMCRQDYPYPKGEYRPKTCGQFECLYKYLHPEVFDMRYRKQLEEIRMNRESQRR